MVTLKDLQWINKPWYLFQHSSVISVGQLAPLLLSHPPHPPQEVLAVWEAMVAMKLWPHPQGTANPPLAPVQWLHLWTCAFHRRSTLWRSNTFYWSITWCTVKICGTKPNLLYMNSEVKCCKDIIFLINETIKLLCLKMKATFSCESSIWVKLEFGNVDFWGGKPSYLKKENQQQTQPTLLVGGKQLLYSTHSWHFFLWASL